MWDHRPRGALPHLANFESAYYFLLTCSVIIRITYSFQKAFDKVPHQRLKLKSHGMGNSIINWIEQWLTEGDKG